MRKIVALLLYFVALTGFSQVEEGKRITQILCSEAFQGRGYVNGGDSIAAAFIAEEFRNLGVKPLGTDYYQHFSFPVNTFPGRLYLDYEGVILKPDVQYMVDPGSGSYDGPLKPLTLHIQDILNEDALGAKIRSIRMGTEYNSVLLDLVGVGADTLKDLRGIEAALAGVIPVISLTDSKFNWSVAHEQYRNPVIYLQDSVYHDSGNFSLQVHAEFINSHETQNVIAFIPAKKKCAKTIVFTAHYDHLGRMGKDAYFPGANDNASGTAMLLTMAKYFLEHPSKYNIQFIAFAGEEAGLLGSKYYTEHPLAKLKKIKFLINLDIMGSGEDGITVVNATLFPKQFELLQSINKQDSLLKEIKSRGPAANSDHYWFTEKGVPAFFIYTMGPNKHYHDIFDTYEELSFMEFNDIVRLLTSFVEEL